MKKKFSRVIAHYLPQCLLLISLLTSNVLFPATVIAQEIENTNNVTQEETVPIDTSEDILEEGISTSVFEETEVETEKELIEEEEVVEPLFVFENGIYTVNTVVEGEEYVYPDNNDVRVKFTEVTQEGNLVIKRVELTEEQKELLNTKDSYGWDITSSMENGTFKYNLTLPNTQGNEDIEVKYTEDNNTYESIDNNNVEIKSNVVTIEGLDHFTVFVVTKTLPTGVLNGGVCTVASIEGVCYDTIQGAINAASNGNTIKVNPGTYDETLVISESKNNIAIEAIRDTNPVVIKPTTVVPSTSRIVDIRGNNIKFTYFLIDGGSQSYVGISISGQENTIESNIIQNVLTGIQTTTAKADGNNRIAYNTVRSATVAISLQNDKNWIEKNAFVDISSEGMGVLNSQNSTIIENKFFINTTGVNLKDHSNESSYVNFSDIIDKDKGKNVFSNLVYITDSSGNILGNTLYTKISDAINAASDGNIINVGDGTYTEDLDITKRITLKSINGYTKTTIKGSIQISRDNVTIDGFIIDNKNQTDGRAIAPKGSTGTTIKNNKITNAYRGIQGDYYGRPKNLAITNNIFENISYGIAGTEDITNLLITGNTFKTSQEGIGLGAGMTFPTGKTIDNLLTDNTFNLTGGYAVVDYRYGVPIPYQALFAEIVSVTTNKEYYKKGDTLTIKVTVKNTGTIPFETTTEKLAVNIMSPSNTYISGTFAEYRPFSLGAGESTSLTFYTDPQTIPSSWTEGTYNVHTSIYSSRVPKGYLDGGQYRGTPFVIDNQKPSIEIISSPEANSVHNGTLEIKVKGSDSNGLGLFVVNLYKTGSIPVVKPCVNQNMNGALVEGTVTCTINTSSYTDGSYYIKTNVRDLAGNLSTTLDRTFIFDKTAPTGTIDSIYYPSKDMSVNSFITNDNTPILEGTYSDANIATIILKIDSTEQSLTYVNNNWKTSEPTASLSDGEHTATLTITDKAENTFTTTQTLFIDTIAPFAIHTYYKNDIAIADSKTYVKSVSELSFKATYIDNPPSSGILKDSYVIFDSNADGTARTGTAYCGWRDPNNTVNIPYSDTVPFTKCEPILSDGQYFMYHQVYDNATRQDIPTITQFSDVKGLYFVVDNVAPTSEINIIGNLAETKGLNHNNGWHGNGWYYNFTEVKPYISSGSEIDDHETIQYQILENEVTCPSTLSSPIGIGNGENIATTINSLSDGVYTLCYQAKDSAGNLETPNQITLKLDKTNPEYEIKTNTINGNEVNGAYYIPSNTISLDINGGDESSGYFRTRYDLIEADGNWNCTGPWTLHETDLSVADNDHEQTLKVSDLKNGRYCLNVWIYDDVQNKAWADINGVSTIHFVIDTERPQAPSNLSFKNKTTGNLISCGSYSNIKNNLTEQWSAYTDPDFSHYEYSSFDAPNDQPGIVEKEFDTNYFDSSWWQIPREGGYSFMVRSVDLAGNKSDWSNKCRINIDWTPPSAPTIKYPSEGAYFKSTPILNDWSDVEDTSGIANYRIEYIYDDEHDFSGKPYRTSTESQRNHMPADNEQGGVKFKVQAFDNAGNEGAWSEYVHYYFDKTDPEAPTLISPTNNSVVNGSILTNEWNSVTDAVKYIYESYNDENATSPRFTETYTTTSKSAYNVQNANIWWRVKSVDAAGNESQWSTLWKVTIDNDKPTTTLTSDPSGTYTNMPVSITGQSTDTNGIDSVNISYRLTGTTDWISLTTIDNTSNDSPYDFTYEWTPTSDGTYDIKVSATDIAGNIEQSAYIYALTYDSTAPSITVFNIVSNILNISANDLLSGTDKVEVKIDNGAWTPYTTDMNLNTILNNTPGTYTIYVKVTDKAGNPTEDSMEYTIPQPAPAPAQTPATTEGAVLGAITTKTTKGITKTISPISTIQTEEILGTTSIEEPFILGKRCENKKKVSGYVYIDKNKDKEMNENEERIKDITLTIQYTDEKGNIKTEEEVNTDEKGYWKTQLCSRKYNIVVKEDTLPKNIEVSEVLSLTVSDNEEETIFNIQALDTRNFWQKYWYLIVGGLAIIAIGYISIKNKKKEEI